MTAENRKQARPDEVDAIRSSFVTQQMHPSIWAASFWQTIHSAALGYPESPTDLNKALYRSFFVNIGDVIPCGVCADGYRRLMLLDAKHTGGLSLDAAIDRGGDALFEWTVQMHNAVNREVGKPDSDWTPERARRAVMAFTTGGEEGGKANQPMPHPSTYSKGPADDGDPSLATIVALSLSLAVGFAIAMGFWKLVASLSRRWKTRV